MVAGGRAISSAGVGGGDEIGRISCLFYEWQVPREGINKIGMASQLTTHVILDRLIILWLNSHS